MGQIANIVKSVFNNEFTSDLSLFEALTIEVESQTYSPSTGKNTTTTTTLTMNGRVTSVVMNQVFQSNGVVQIGDLFIMANPTTGQSVPEDKSFLLWQSKRYTIYKVQPIDVEGDTILYKMYAR